MSTKASSSLKSMVSPGCAARKLRMAGIRRPAPNPTEAATFKAPSSVRSLARAIASAAWTSSLKRLASGKNASPARVSAIARVERTSSFAPSRASSAATCLLTALCVAPSSLATAENDPRSTTRTKVRIASRRSMAISFQFGMNVRPSLRLLARGGPIYLTRRQLLKGSLHDHLFRSYPRRRHARQPGDLRQSEKSPRLRTEPVRHFCLFADRARYLPRAAEREIVAEAQGARGHQPRRQS